MLHYALFASSVDAREQVALGLESYPGLFLLKAFDHALSPEALLDYLRAHSPQVLLFDIGGGNAPLLEAAELLRGSERTHLVALDRELDAEVLLELMNAGVGNSCAFPSIPKNWRIR